MKSIVKLTFSAALSMLTGFESAQAAVMCVENKTTGKFDEKVDTRGRITGECDAHAYMNKALSVAEMESSAAAGTRIIDGVIVTNAAKPFEIGIAKSEAPAASTSSAVSAPNIAVKMPAVSPAPDVRSSAVRVDAKAPTQAPSKTNPNDAQRTPTAIAGVAHTQSAPPLATSEIATSAMPPPAPPQTRAWDVRTDDRTIYGTLVRWAAMAVPKRQVAWELPREFELSAGDSDNPFIGTFEEAVDRVLDSFDSADYPPKGCFYDNGVLRVIRRIGDGMECKR